MGISSTSFKPGRYQEPNETSFKEGNQASLKYKTPEERKKVFKELCEHLEGGFSFAAFPYLAFDTIKSYCKRFPSDFESEKLQEAINKGRLFWEKLGTNGTSGKIDGFRDKTYQFIMMNKYNMSINQKSDVKVKAEVNVAELSDEELKEIVNE